LRVILPDEARTLRDQQDFAGRAVINILGYLGGDLSGQIGVQPGDEGRRDDRAGLNDISACRRLNAVRAGGAPIDGAVEEGELVVR
jgi:hypothetical protein